MKAITLYEPWASLMSIGAKVNETRGCRTSHRGDICIHAAKTDHGTPEDLIPAILKAFQTRHTQPHPDSLGCIIAVVDLWDVQPSSRFAVGSTARPEFSGTGGIVISDEEFAFGNYGDGRFIFRTRNLRRLKTPVPCRGFQSIGWTVPPEVEAKVRAELCPHDTDGDGNCPLHPKGCHL